MGKKGRPVFLFPVRGKAKKGGNENEKLKKLYNQIANYCRKNLIDTASAEECTQEVFAIYFEKASQIEICNPRAWLFRTADNYLHKYNQKFQQKKREIFPLPDPEDVDDMEDVRFGYEQDFFPEGSVDIDKDVEKVLSGLNDDEFELYDLHFRKRLSLQELTISYDSSIPAVKNKIYRLKQHILQLVQKFMDDENKN